MGACGSSENLSPEEAQRRKLEKDRSKQLEAQMSTDHSIDQQINKLLLLGAGESGTHLFHFIHFTFDVHSMWDMNLHTNYPSCHHPHYSSPCIIIDWKSFPIFFENIRPVSHLTCPFSCIF